MPICATCSLPTSHDPFFVALSIALATLSSYVALDLSGRTPSARGGARTLWIAGGSISLGVGIWSMHFVGMLAFHLHDRTTSDHLLHTLPVAYNLPLVLLSVTVAIAASAFAIGTALRGGMAPLALMRAGGAIGIGMAGMHYIGMAAMRMPAFLGWNWWLVALSVLIAVVAAAAALQLLARAGEVRTTAGIRFKLVAAATMGCAIAGMHYTGMAAARFQPAAERTTSLLASTPDRAEFVGSSGLAVAIAVAATLTLLAGALSATLDRAHRRKMAGTLDTLSATEARLRTIFEHAAFGIALHDVEGQFLEANPAYQKIVGYSLTELRVICPAELTPLAEDMDERVASRESVDDHTQLVVERDVLRPDGEVRRCALTVSRVEGGAGTRGLVGMLQDVTEQFALEEELTYRAYHDSLTGLVNRARFQECAIDALARLPENSGLSVYALLIDLDRFKLVNDSAGHAAGDAVLREVAARLLTTTRPNDVIARLGGDEFAVLLDAVHDEGVASTIAQRIIDALAQPIVFDDLHAVIGASIGIARGALGDDTPGISAVGTLLRNADLALYEAKSRGRGQYVKFEPAMHAAVVERLDLENALREALPRGELVLEYQPIVELTTGTLWGVEALLRWQHPTRGTVGPNEFIPIAEESGLIRSIGRWVFERACLDGAAWHRDGRAPFMIAVNVSPRQLQDASFVVGLREVLASTGFGADRLVLELTEGSVARDPAAARDRLTELRALGVRIAIDDFGTGYSALSHLRQLPIDILKIDKSFVDPIAGGGQPAAPARAIATLSDALELSLIAEGVETLEQLDALIAMGCPLAQGYYLSRPLRAEAVEPQIAALQQRLRRLHQNRVLESRRSAA